MIRLLTTALLGLGSPAEAQETPEKFVLDLGGGVKMEFLKIKAGKFVMAVDAEKHEVTLTKDFWMQTTETTQAHWEAIMGDNPSKFKGADLPVESVSWENCQEFLKKLNEKTKDPLKGKTAGLPTNAQWEYACRAGEKGKWWCFGGDGEQLGDYTWYDDNSDEKTHPVGQKKPNAWGLYDVHGNVAEWCEDRYERYSSEAVTDPTGPEKGDERVTRGGSWGGGGASACFSSRKGFMPGARNDELGLRVALRSAP